MSAMPQTSGKPTGEAARKIIDEAYKRWQSADENERERREIFKKNLRMLTMEQWPDKDRQVREAAGRPVMTDDRLSPAVQTIVNSARENRPSAKVHPISAEADEDTAQVIEGGIRHIEYASQASIAYDTAFDSAAGRGWGWFGFTTEYCDDGSFDNQDIVFRAIANTLSVYKDTSSVKPDASDQQWNCVIEVITDEEYKARYGDKDPLVVRGFQSASADTQSQWVTANTVTLCEYWRIVQIPRKRLLVERDVYALQPDGSPGIQIQQFAVNDDEYQPRPNDRILKQRDNPKPKVEQYMLTADEVKEYREWAGKWIPLVEVQAKEIYDAEGKRKLISAIEHAIPNQMKLNVYSSFEAESVALAGRPKWMGPLGSFKTKQKDFDNHNRSNITSLEYDPVQISPGNFAPPPSWVTFNPQIEFCLAGQQSCISAIQASTMVYDPELGRNSSPDQSGLAINALQKKAQQGNYHLFDNLTRSQWHGYRILVDLFPKIYDSAREIGWLGPDQAKSVYKVNQPYTDPKTGKVKTHMLDAGKYGVVIDVGPSYDSQRLEAKGFVTEMVGNPEVMQRAGDIIVELQDLGPIGDKLAARLAPPGLGKDDAVDDPAKMQQALAQFTQQTQQMTQTIHQLVNEKEVEAQKYAYQKQIKQMEYDLDKWKAELSSNTSIAVAEINAKTQLGLLMGKNLQDKEMAALGFTQNLHDSAHEAAMASMDHSHQLLQAQQAADNTPVAPTAPAGMPVQ